MTTTASEIAILDFSVTTAYCDVVEHGTSVATYTRILSQQNPEKIIVDKLGMNNLEQSIGGELLQLSLDPEYR